MCSWRKWAGLWLWSCAIKHSVDPSFEDYWRQHSKVKHGENIVAFPESFRSLLHTMVMDSDGRALAAGAALVEVSICLNPTEILGVESSDWTALKVHICFIFVLSQFMFIFLPFCFQGGADVPPPPRSRAESQGCNLPATCYNLFPTLPRAMWMPKIC